MISYSLIIFVVGELPEGHVGEAINVSNSITSAGSHSGIEHGRSLVLTWVGSVRSK